MANNPIDLPSQTLRKLSNAIGLPVDGKTQDQMAAAIGTLITSTAQEPGTREGAANYALIPARLDIIRVSALNNSVLHQFITDAAGGVTYRVDAEPPYGTIGTTDNYTLTPQANQTPRPYFAPTTDGLGYSMTTSYAPQTLVPTTDGLGFRVT
jgi:hypothetical protein